jgi:hypothetical protein
MQLHNGIKAVVRVILPVHESWAEVATVRLVRGKALTYIVQPTSNSTSNTFFHSAQTAVPVPQVHLYCSNPQNPVHAEWIIIEDMPSTILQDCLELFNDEQVSRTDVRSRHLGY